MNENRGVDKRHESGTKTFITLSWTLLSLYQQLEVEELAVFSIPQFASKAAHERQTNGIEIAKRNCSIWRIQTEWNIKIAFFLHFI